VRCYTAEVELKLNLVNRQKFRALAETLLATSCVPFDRDTASPDLTSPRSWQGRAVHLNEFYGDRSMILRLPGRDRHRQHQVIVRPLPPFDVHFWADRLPLNWNCASSLTSVAACSRVGAIWIRRFRNSTWKTPTSSFFGTSHPPIVHDRRVTGRHPHRSSTPTDFCLPDQLVHHTPLGRPQSGR
jgi:hypothetical protein